MIKYNICFIKRGHEILLLNREYPSWMGCWNGIGGKVEQGETPRDSMIREIEEETNMKEYTLSFKGIITWSVDGSHVGGMYTYMAEVPETLTYATPIKTDEGILDWKTMGWVLHEQNRGIAANIPESIETILHDPDCYDHLCVYENGLLKNQTSRKIDPLFEHDEALRDAYLSQFNKETSGIR
ncbi:NUDIX domain-containing protein [Paenibacillus tarimensis]